MAYELSWGQMVDQPVSDQSTLLRCAQSILWGFKSFLKGVIGPGGTGVWTVTRSSDGVSVSDSDLWGDTFDPSKIVRAAVGTAHSWIVLKAPASLDSSLYIVLDCSGSTDQMLVATPRFSKLGYPGGTVTNAPTAADDTSCMTPAAAMCDAITYVHKLNGILSARGDFVFFAWSLNRSIVFNASCFGLMETRPTDQWPFTVMINATGFVGTAYSYFAKNQEWKYRVGSGLVPSGGHSGLLLPYMSGGQYFLDAAPPSGDYQTHKWAKFPAYLGYSQTTYGLIKGRLPDVALGPMMPSAPGAQSPGTGGVEYTLIGGLWLPFTVCPTF